MAEETTHKVTRALFPGSFDPFTAGHLNILKRAISSDKISITLEDGILHAAMEQFHAAYAKGVIAIAFDDETYATAKQLFPNGAAQDGDGADKTVSDPRRKHRSKTVAFCHIERHNPHFQNHRYGVNTIRKTDEDFVKIQIGRRICTTNA